MSAATHRWGPAVPAPPAGLYGEAVLSGSAASVAYFILAAFFGGFTLGVLAMVAVNVRKEDRRFSLSGAAPSAAAGGTRWLTRYGGSGSYFLPRGRG